MKSNGCVVTGTLAKGTYGIELEGFSNIRGGIDVAEAATRFEGCGCADFLSNNPSALGREACSLLVTFIRQTALIFRLKDAQFWRGMEMFGLRMAFCALFFVFPSPF